MICSKQAKKWFKECLKNNELVEKIKKIKLIITDIDGCLTDGQILMHENENEKSKAFSVRDGFATNKAISNNNLLIAFLSGRKDLATKTRAKMLGIPEDMCFIGGDAGKDKKIKVQLIQKNKNIKKEETLMFGDDFLDIQTRELVELLACPQDTPFYFSHVVDLIVNKTGGKHAFRLLLDLILYVQEKHFAQEFIKKSLEN